MSKNEILIKSHTVYNAVSVVSFSSKMVILKLHFSAFLFFLGTTFRKVPTVAAQISDPIFEACGRDGGVTFISNSGSFFDFGNPVFIRANNCSWTINLNASLDLHITFEELNSPCSEGFIEITKPGDSYVDYICGSEVSQPLIITLGTVTFSHQRHFFDAFATFTISWTSTSESNIEKSSTNTTQPPNVTCYNLIKDSKGFIASDGFPRNYQNNIDQCWTFPKTENMYELKMLGGQMEIEGSFDCQHDYLLISTDNGVNKYCEHNIPTLQSKQLTVAFHSDSSIAARGFALAYGVKDADGTGLVNETDIICGASNLTETSGYISSPGFPITYVPNTNCQWMISASVGKAINFTFIYFQLPYSSSCSDNYIELRDHKSASPKRLCSDPYQGLSTSTNELYLTFHSGPRSSSTSGFALTYYFIDLPNDPVSCGGTLQPWSVLQSPNQPDFYPPNMDCIWTIEVQPNETITLRAHHFDIEKSENCSADFLEIQGKNEKTGQLLCGYQPRKLAEYTGTEIMVHFQSDSILTGYGFFIYIESNVPVTCNSTDISSGDAGYIFSPNYPSFYPRNVHCEWTISTNNRVIITVEDMDIERSNDCIFDALVIYDGSSSENNKQIYCGSSPPPTFESSGNTMTVEFITDESDSGKGFLLTWHDSSVTTASPPVKTTSAAQDSSSNTTSPSVKTTSAAQGLLFDHVIFLMASFAALMVQQNYRGVT